MIMVIMAELEFHVVFLDAEFDAAAPSSGSSKYFWRHLILGGLSVFCFILTADKHAEQAPEFSNARSDRKGLQDI